MTDDSNKPPRAAPSVFLSYSRADKPAVRQVAERLQDAGIRVWWDELMLPGTDWSTMIEDELKASDYVLLFISSSSVNSALGASEPQTAKTIQEFSDRSITLVPVLLEDVHIRGPLSTIQYLDFRHDPNQALESFIDRFQGSLQLDFTSLSGSAFEDLVEDLLNDLGFATERNVSEQGRRFDFRASFRGRDPFGAEVDENWFVEAKHYSTGRLSVAAIAEFVHLARAISEPATRLALITSGQITSAGRDLVRSAPIRVVEGVELKRILLTRPHLVARHLRPRRK